MRSGNDFVLSMDVVLLAKSGVKSRDIVYALPRIVLICVADFTLLYIMFKIQYSRSDGEIRPCDVATKAQHILYNSIYMYYK